MPDGSCREVRELLVDKRGLGWSREMREHLERCRECAAFAALVASLAPGSAAAAPDYDAADLALARAEEILRKRRERGDLVLFLACAAAICAAIAVAGATGFGLPILVLEGLAFLTLPFVGFGVLRRRARGGTAWTA
jgi:hypothetical protein